MLVCWRGDIHELAYFLGCFQLPVGLCLPTQKSGMGSLPGESEGCVGCERYFAMYILFWFDMFRLQLFFFGFFVLQPFFRPATFFFLVFDPHVLSHAEIGHGVTSREK